MNRHVDLYRLNPIPRSLMRSRCYAIGVEFETWSPYTRTWTLNVQLLHWVLAIRGNAR